MKVEVKKFVEPDGSETVATITYLGAGLPVIETTNPQVDDLLRGYLTFDADLNEHSFTDGAAWLENLPRSMARGTRMWAEFVDDGAPRASG